MGKFYALYGQISNLSAYLNLIHTGVGRYLLIGQVKPPVQQHLFGHAHWALLCPHL